MHYQSIATHRKPKRVLFKKQTPCTFRVKPEQLQSEKHLKLKGFAFLRATKKVNSPTKKRLMS